MTGLTVSEFDELVKELTAAFVEAETQRLSRPHRQRAIGAGRKYALEVRDQFLLTIVWLRRYPTHLTLGYFFGVSDATPSRTIRRILPLLEAAGRDTMRLPNPGRKQGRQLDDLLRETPALAVVVDTFEQRVQRPQARSEADSYYSGKKKQHTLKSQIAVDDYSGLVVDVAHSARGPTADLTLLRASGLLLRLPAGVGALGDLAYVGMAGDHPQGLAATPRRKPRSQPRPEADVTFNTAFARRRIVVEHTIARLRIYLALTLPDRQHRQGHTARVVAVAGLVNYQIGRRFVH